MFLGREAEMNFLNHYYAMEGSQIVVVYGQKNIGKTTLIRHFAERANNSYYLARPCSAKEQRYQWGEELREKGKEIAGYPRYQEIFEQLFGQITEKQILLLDEFHYLVKADNEFMDALLQFVENRRLSRPVMVVLCTSASGWVENSMVGKMGSAAFYLNGLLKVKELKFGEMAQLYPRFSLKDRIGIYAVLGGFPGLWKSLDDSLSMKENLIRHVLRRESRLYGEMSVIMSEELREPAVYNTILASLARGGDKLNDIYRHTDFSRAKISVYLKNLMELELVEKVFSYETDGMENTRKGIYRIANPYVRFYFSFLYPNQSLLQEISPEEFYERKVAPGFGNFAGDAYKKVCRELLEQWRAEGRLPVDYVQAGEWAGKSGDLDMVAQDGEGRTMVALCSFDKKITYEDWEWFQFCVKQAKLEPDYSYLFSESGFEEEILAEAQKNDTLFLCSAEEIPLHKK